MEKKKRDVSSKINRSEKEDLKNKEKEYHLMFEENNDSAIAENIYRGILRRNNTFDTRKNTVNSGNIYININDAFINCCRHDRCDVHITMTDGSLEIGTIQAFDANAILIKNFSTDIQTLLMKNQIIKLSPMKSPYYSKKEIGEKS
ncbi:MAG: hypothetical protein WCR87_06790 [Saccharofermentanales bacterium]